MKQEPIFKLFIQKSSTKTLTNQGGQAVVEFILMMIVTVSLVLSLRGVFTSMNNFMSDFMGEYVVCLMEYGELPSLGVSNADLKQHEEGVGKKCEFRKFSGAVAAGSSSGSGSGSGPGAGPGSGPKAPGNSSNSGDNNRSAGRAGGRDGKTSGSSDTSDGSSSASERKGSSAASAGSSSGSRGSTPYGRGQITRSDNNTATADAPQDLNSNKVKVVDDINAKKSGDRGGFTRNEGRRVTYANGKYKAITGTMADEIEKKSRMSPRKPSSGVLQKSEGGYRFLPHIRTITPPERNVAVDEKKDESFSFGSFFKWLIIAGIVIVCFILFGGQLLNFSNSSDS